MKLRTVRRAVQRVNIRLEGVERVICAENVGDDRSVPHELAYTEGAILYIHMLRGLVLAHCELGVGEKA